MRQRNIKNLQEKLRMNSSFLIEEPCAFMGRWKEVFSFPAPLCLEIGCGKGQFITGYARSCPDFNFIAVEGQSNVALRALEKAEESRLENLRIFISYINDLKEFFEKGELSAIFLNFSDPWPKARHAKRRLTYRERLLNYKEVLTEDGFIEFKTDNDGLFEFTLGEISEAGLEITEQTRNLHDGEGIFGKESCGEPVYDGGCGGEKYLEREVCGLTPREEAPCARGSGKASDFGGLLKSKEITTEYEDRFREKGKNINYVKFR